MSPTFPLPPTLSRTRKQTRKELETKKLKKKEKKRKRKRRDGEVTSQDESIQLVTHWCVPLAGKRQIATLDGRGVRFDNRVSTGVYVSSGRDARRLNAPLRGTDSRLERRQRRRHDATPLPANQPTSRRTIQLASHPVLLSLPAVSSQPPYRLSNPHQPSIENYAERDCVYRHAPDKLEGVSAGGITSPGKNSPSRVSLSPSLFLLPSVGNVRVEESLGI